MNSALRSEKSGLFSSVEAFWVPDGDGSRTLGPPVTFRMLSYSNRQLSSPLDKTKHTKALRREVPVPLWRAFIRDMPVGLGDDGNVTSHDPLTTALRAAPANTPTLGVEPRDALATSMFAARGVYAFLIGSGMSTAAGVLTGARIVEDLVRQVARQRGVPPASYDTDPTAWWVQVTGAEPRYDELLSRLAPTDGARRAVLRQYFEVRADTGAAVLPTDAHHALARLCADGFVRVILTTNFDTLIEQALDAAGVSCQVLVGEEGITGRVPLVHAPVTLAKLHGDYRTTGLKNSPEELASYGTAQTALLHQVMDEYGLVIVGWSAEWDRALVASLQAGVSRRYPMYWVAYHGVLGPTARQLVTNRQAFQVASDGADDFLPDLVQRVKRLGERARRRATPVFRRGYLNQPPDGLSNGWEAAPWLTLRTAAMTSSIDADSLGIIGPEVRERIVATLRRLPTRGQLAAWNSRRPLDATPRAQRSDDHIDSFGATSPPHAVPLEDWIVIPGLQSANRIAYRLGGNGRVGISATAAVRMPDTGFGEILIFHDIGISVEGRLQVAEIASVLRDGLVLVTAELPNAIADVLPTGTVPVRCDVHLFAGRADGRGGSRDNSVAQHVNLDLFRNSPADPPSNESASWGFGAEISGGLTRLDAGELIADGMNYLALTEGFLDPRPAVSAIRAVLGLPPRSR